MKKKIFSALLLTVAVICCLCSCVDFASAAKNTNEEFLREIKVGDYYYAASEYLHPMCELDVKEYFTQIEREYNIEFNGELVIEQYNSYEISRLDDDGTACKLDYILSVNGTILYCEVAVVNDDYGYGIYQIEIEK